MLYISHEKGVGGRVKSGSGSGKAERESKKGDGERVKRSVLGRGGRQIGREKRGAGWVGGRG